MQTCSASLRWLPAPQVTWWSTAAVGNIEITALVSKTCDTCLHVRGVFWSVSASVYIPTLSGRWSNLEEVTAQVLDVLRYWALWVGALARRGCCCG